MKRVGIVGLLHESNTFVKGATLRSDFEADLLLHGPEIRAKMENAPHEVGGFFRGLESEGIEVVPVFLARALPYGTIEAETFEGLVEEVLSGVRAAGELDGILAAPHGATVSELYPDADGYWLSELRRQTGPHIPIVATIDPHANLSRQMVEATDAIIAYSTNPHLDQRETGIKAAQLMSTILNGDATPSQFAVYPDMAINIQSQNTSVEPMSALYRKASELCSCESVLSWSIVLGFPYADVEEMGSAVLVVTDNDSNRAEQLAREIGESMWSMREEFEPAFLPIEEAVAEASGSEEGPVVLLDMGDNVGGGSPADSTAIAREWVRNGTGRALVVLCDADSVEKAVSVGVGNEALFSVGDPDYPVLAECRVCSIHDGKFREDEARHGGFSEFDQGRTALLETLEGKLTIMATTKRMAPFSLCQLTTFGVKPEDYQMIVAKGVIAPMAAYSPVARGGFLHVDSPGVTRANMKKLSFENRRRPMFPFETEFDE